MLWSHNSKTQTNSILNILVTLNLCKVAYASVQKNTKLLDIKFLTTRTLFILTLAAFVVYKKKTS